jgi:hypothetical protein
MSWLDFLLLLHIKTSNFCFKQNEQAFNTCYELVIDCVLDGESFEFCTKGSER